MIKLSKEDIEEITNENVPRGQILTSGWKKYVFIPDKGKFLGFVFKGPWKKTEEKISVIEFRTKVFRMCEASVLIPEFCEDGDDVWLKFPNIATTDPSEWKYSISQGKLDKYPVRVIDRESLGYKQLSKEDLHKQVELLFGPDLFFKNYILMALLKVGDMGPWNTLITPKGKYIVDYDDNSARKEIKYPKDFFSKTNNKALISSLNDQFKLHFPALLKYYTDLAPKVKEIQELANSMSVPIDVKKNYEMIGEIFQ